MADGGLINPEAFPAKSSDLDTSKITGSASDLRSMGTTVKTQVGDIDRSWGGLKSHYEAPEQDRVYELMDPAVTSASDLKTTLGKVAGYLDTYASTLDGIKPRLADLERRARAFRADVIDGVKVDASEAKDASFGDHAKGAIDWVPGVDEKQVTVPWNEDGDTVSKNEELLGEYAGLLEEITTAVAKCANDTNALVENMCVAPVEATPAEAFTNPQQPMPWGSAVEEDRNCPESVGHGAKNFGTGLAEGAGMLVLGYNPDNGEFFTGDGYGQSWGGLGDLLGSTVVTSAAGWTQMAYAATGHDRDEMPDWTTSEWMEERADVTVGGWGQMVGYDHQAATNGGDGWHKWKDDGWAAGTESVLNVGTFFIPGAGTAGAVVKGGSGAARASRIARIADGVADFALPGGSWAVRGGTQLTSKLRFLDGFNNGVPSAITRGAGRPDAPYAGLINAVDDIPETGPGGHTPVSDTTFGERPPQTPDVNGTPENPTRPEPGSTAPDTPARPDSPSPTPGTRPGGAETRPLPDRAGWDGMSPEQVRERVTDVTEGRSPVSADDVRAMPDNVRTQLLDSIDSRHGRPDAEQGMQDLRAEMRDPDSAVGETLRDAAAKSEAKNPEWRMIDPDAPSESGLTNSGRLTDGTVPEQLQSLVDDGVVRVDDGVLRLAEPVRVEFDTPALQANPVEAQRQLSQQAQGLSELNAGRWLDNFEAHQPGATRVDPPMHGAVRDQLKELRVGQLEDLGFEPDAARGMADAEYKTKALLHSPDGVAGGNTFGYTGMGDRGVNSAIGSGWNGRRRTDLFEQIESQLEGIPPEFWGDVRLDVELRVPR